MNGRSARSLIRRLLGALLLAAVGLVAGAIGIGLISLHVTSGASMLPAYHDGDLAVVAPASAYRAGQVVAYRIAADNEGVVLHRIVGGDEAGFVMKGDNNESVDTVRPTARQVIGRQILHVGGVGALLGSTTARVVLLVVLAASLAAMMRSRRQSSPGPRRVAGRRREIAAMGLVGVDGLLLIALVLTLALPPQAPAPQQPALTHTGMLTYKADVPTSDTYPTGEVTTGDPVFVRLLQSFQVSFHYDTTAPPASVSGTGRVDAVLSNASGWQRTLPVVRATPLHAGAIDLNGTVDVSGILRIAASVAEATGVDTSTLGVAIIGSANVSIDGDTPVVHTTRLPFQLTPLVLAMNGVTPTSSPDGPVVTSTGAIPNPEPAPPEPVDVVRRIRLSLLAVLLLCAGLTAALWREPSAPPVPPRARNRVKPRGNLGPMPCAASRPAVPRRDGGGR